MSSKPDDLPNESTPTKDSSTDKNVKDGEDKTVTVQVNEDEQEENEEKDEDPKETKKSLLHENEEKHDVAITFHGYDDEEKDIPTLPKKKGTSDVRDETGSPREKRPSVITSPLKRLKYEWEYSSNVIEFIARVICLVFATVGWIVLVGGVPLLSIVEIVVGSVYLHNCPADPRIPEYLIVAGVFGTILHGITAFTRYTSKSGKDDVNPSRRGCLCVEAILEIFLFIWFIAGCVWVYSIYEPEYVHENHDEYCHKGLYLFAFWMFNLTFIIFLLIICLALCGIAVAAFSS